MEILIALVGTLILLVLIVFACSVFTNAIEWVGHRFQLSQGAVGSVLAAVGTALPETLVPIVAIVSGVMGVASISVEEGQEIGIGAILGAPFLLSTLAMFVSAVAVFVFAGQGKRSTQMHVETHLFKRDLQYFFAAYAMVVLAAFVCTPVMKMILAGLLVVYYGIYVYRTMTKEHMADSEFELEALMFAPTSGLESEGKKEPHTYLILLQVLAGLLGILICAHLFVDQVKHISTLFHLNPLVLSLIIAPIATELPEKFNSVVWISKKKDVLAIGNITGAMVFQSCIPTAVGLAFTPWVLTPQALASVVLTFVSSLLIYFFGFLKEARYMPYVMLLGGVCYVAFLWMSLR